MSMAVVCAHLNLLGPSVVATESKSCSSCNVASPSAAFLFRHKTNSGRTRQNSVTCRSSAGGQRRDNDKRRERTNWDATPSKPIPDTGKIDENLNAINDDLEYNYEKEGIIIEGEEVIEDYEALRREDRVGENLEDIRVEGQESAQAVSQSASDSVDAGGRRVQRAGRRVGQNLDEARRAGQAGEAGRAVDNIQEGVEEAGRTAQDLAGIAQEGAEDAGQLRDAGSSIGDDLQNVGQEGQKALERGAGAVSKQAREASRELGQQAEQTEQRAERAVRTGYRRAQESAERVQEPIEKAVNASINAAAAIGDEVFRLGDTFIEAVEEVTGLSGPERPYRPPRAKKSEADDSEVLVGGKYRPAGKSVVKRYQGIREDGDDSEDQGQGEGEDGSFSELTVLVAGATGATGRLIVQELVGKGATVRALVRNVYRARNLKQLQGAELFEGDLYNYESVKEAISGCNVVVSAVGKLELRALRRQSHRSLHA